MVHETRRALQAAALRYDADVDNAPRLIAAGEGHVARRIIEKAEEHGIAVVRDAALAGSLVGMDVGREIPVELYIAAAKVLTFVYALEQKQTGKSGGDASGKGSEPGRIDQSG